MHYRFSAHSIRLIPRDDGCVSGVEFLWMIYGNDNVDDVFGCRQNLLMAHFV